jgi:sentrin-specific protease 1
MAPQTVYKCALLRPRTSVVGTRAGVTLRTLDLRTIVGTNYLNDNVINYYLSLILAKAKVTLDVDAFALSTYFYSSMVRGNISMDSWTSGIDIFIKDYVLFPVHTGAGDHWCIAVFDVRKHTLNVYDSIPNEGRKFDILHHVRAYIREEHKSKHGLPYPYALNEDSVPDVPLQTNGFDCGVFVCQYVKAIVRGVRFNFRSKDMQIIRRTMIWEIAHG